MNNFFKLKQLSILTTGVVCLQSLSVKAEATQKQPNILIAVADDWGFSHAGAYGCKWISTPAFDYVAGNGICFTNAYTPNAKSAPSRACLLTGRNSWQLEQAGNHIGYWPENKFLTFIEALAQQNFAVGFTGKGWGPGNPGMKNGQVRQLTGKEYNDMKLTPPTKAMGRDDYAANFEAFLKQKPKDKSFCFWYGGREPHRPYAYGSGAKVGGKKTSDIDLVPRFWPDNDSVRHDMLDYAFEIEHMDKQLDKMIKLLTENGELENTIIIVTSDNGMPFPRSKGLQYDYSNHMPLAIMWPKGVKNPGRTVTDYVSFVDLAPTLLQSVGIDWKSSGMEPTPGKSLTDIFQNKKKLDRSFILLGQERHDVGRPNNQGYPIRSIIKDGFLYLYNFKPELWPVGNPETGYLNTDGGPTKTVILNMRRSGSNKNFWNLNFGKHLQEEMYQVSVDKECLVNLADKAEFAQRRETMKKLLFEQLKSQNDPRVLGNGDLFDTYPFYEKTLTDFYERYMQVDSSLKKKTGWINPSDYESEIIQP
jgi:arylsulfatase A-like enzyme